MAPKGDHRRARILSVVADMLSTHEFNEISIAEITRRSDITRQGFYFYFPSKGASSATSESRRTRRSLIVTPRFSLRAARSERGESLSALGRRSAMTRFPIQSRHAYNDRCRLPNRLGLITRRLVDVMVDGAGARIPR